MAKLIHLHPDNGPEPCRADPSKPKAKGCPYGGSSGQEGHYATIGEAQEAWDKKMEEAHGVTSTLSSSHSKYPNQDPTKFYGTFGEREDAVRAAFAAYEAPLTVDEYGYPRTDLENGNYIQVSTWKDGMRINLYDSEGNFLGDDEIDIYSNDDPEEVLTEVLGDYLQKKKEPYRVSTASPEFPQDPTPFGGAFSKSTEAEVREAFTLAQVPLGVTKGGIPYTELDEGFVTVFRDDGEYLVSEITRSGEKSGEVILTGKSASEFKLAGSISTAVADMQKEGGSEKFSSEKLEKLREEKGSASQQKFSDSFTPEEEFKVRRAFKETGLPLEMSSSEFPQAKIGESTIQVVSNDGELRIIETDKKGVFSGQVILAGSAATSERLREFLAISMDENQD